MGENQVKELLAKLLRELDDTDEVDAETLALARELDADIHRLVEASEEDALVDTVLDHARSLETRFAAEHPRAERFLAEIMETLSKLGI